MSTQTLATAGAKKAGSVLLDGAALAIVASVLLGLNRDLGVSDRAAFLVLFLTGLALCAMGKLGQTATYGWANWRHLAGYALGGGALLLAAAVLFRWTIPFIATDEATVLALAGIMLVKTAISLSYPRAA